MAENRPGLDIATLVAEHHALVYGYAYRLSGSAHDAEDLTQQTFLSAQLKLDQLQSVAHSRAWLYAILRNCYLKSHRKRRPLAAGSIELDMETIADDLPAKLAIDEERLQAAINELPDDFKLVLVMFYFEGCSYREIAEQLGWPAGTVMSRLSRAKSRLRSRLVEPQWEVVAGRGRQRTR